MDEVTEREARHGKFVLFPKKDGRKAITVKIRTMNETEDWLDQAHEVEKMGANANGRESQRAYNEALADCVFSYDDSIDRGELELLVTRDELFEGFRTLRYRLDPFLSMQKKRDDENLKQLETTRAVLSVMPPEMQAKAVAMATDTAGNLQI